MKNTQSGEPASGTFFGPYEKTEEPYIRIATGDFQLLKKEEGVFQAAFTILNTLSHEIQHYYQWLDDEEFDEEIAINGAAELTEEYITFFVEGFLKDKFPQCFR
ncbi:hypothetical protein [Listeria ilorinensis]|uniref:hypothetical protein n=1 Tax=Listeria ilorinensis TaxID=2867439 RepID=UPI001EF4281B|nr:hypothetical protein [Listeria ilorinensis]